MGFSLPSWILVAVGICCLAGCATMKAEVSKSRIFSAQDTPSDATDDLRNRAAAADGLVRLTIKFPKVLGENELGGNTEWNRMAILSDCRESNPGAEQTWSSGLENLTVGPLVGSDVLDVYLPRNLGKAVRNGIREPVLFGGITWADRAINDGELCLEIRQARMLWIGFSAKAIKLGKAQGFIAEAG